MNIEKQQLQDLNSEKLSTHKSQFDFLTQTLSKSNIDVNQVIQKLADFQVAIPSWALGAGGTRFGRFSYGGEPASLEQKIEDIGLIHRLTQTAGAVSLHIPWDVPNDYLAIKELAALNKIKFDAVNSNTFQDQKNQKETYKYGSLSSTSAEVREQAIAHNKEVIEIGKKLGSKSLTVWLADGASFPGQNNFQTALTHTQNSLISIYEDMPADWKMFIEYKPYEPH